jgi:hypothetical protein
MQYVHGFTYLLLGFIILFLPDLILPPLCSPSFRGSSQFVSPHQHYGNTSSSTEWDMADLSLRLDELNLDASSSMYKKYSGALFGFLPWAWASPTSGEVERCLVSALGITKI